MSYSFFIQKTTKSGTASGNASNIEVDFTGAHYVSCKGLSSVGKIKNVYSEDYAEADGERVFHPTDNNNPVARESTDIELEILFTGGERRSSYDSFCDYLLSGRIFYWDTARHKKVWLVLNGPITPAEDTLKGSTPYIKTTFKFKNLWGEGKDCNDSGVLV